MTFLVIFIQKIPINFFLGRAFLMTDRFSEFFAAHLAHVIADSTRKIFAYS